jgi:hypothetical protein
MSTAIPLKTVLELENINLLGLLNNAVKCLSESASSSALVLALRNELVASTSESNGHSAATVAVNAAKVLDVLETHNAAPVSFTTDGAFTHIGMIESIAEILTGGSANVNSILAMTGKLDAEYVVCGPSETELKGLVEQDLRELGYSAFEDGAKRPDQDTEFLLWVEKANPQIDPDREYPTIPLWEWCWWEGWNKAYLEENPVPFEADSGIDLLPHYDHQPAPLKAAMSYLEHAVDFEDNQMEAKALKFMASILEPIGFTFEFDFDRVPYALRWIGSAAGSEDA